MSFSPLIDELIAALRCLPGVGPKSAQRMVFHVLQHAREPGQQLADSLVRALNEVGHCERCHTLSEHPLCRICANPRRDPGLLCVLESPVDVLAIEQTGSYSGYYYVLMGHLSPIDGIGPEQLGIEHFIARLQAPELREVILATNPTVEGEATAHYLAELIKLRGLAASRIAHGVPLGGELEFIDGGTLAHALRGRETI
jgi:recombination protein RecR